MLCSQVRRMGITLLVLVATVAGAERAVAQTTLRYKFTKGEKLNYLIDQKISTTTTAAGRDFSTDMVQTINMVWNVTDVDANGKAKMTQTFSRIRFTMDGPLGKIEYDSKDDKEPEGPLAKVIVPIFRALAGSEISLSMDSMGKTSDLKLPEKLITAAKSLPAAAGPLGELLSEEGLKQTMDQSGLFLPKEPVTKGTTWEQKLETKSGFGKMKVDNVYTYQGKAKRDDKEVEQVTMKPKINIESDNPKITIKSQDAKGTAYFDNAVGRIVETSITQNMDIEASLMGQTFTQKVKQTASMKLVK